MQTRPQRFVKLKGSIDGFESVRDRVLLLAFQKQIIRHREWVPQPSSYQATPPNRKGVTLQRRRNKRGQTLVGHALAELKSHAKPGSYVH